MANSHHADSGSDDDDDSGGRVVTPINAAHASSAFSRAPPLLSDDERWRIRALYLPPGSSGLLRHDYSDAHCIAFLCAHLLRHVGATNNSTYDANDVCAAAHRTPHELAQLLAELVDSLARVGTSSSSSSGESASILPAATAAEVSRALCTMLDHPEPLVRLLALEALGEARAMHFALSSGSTPPSASSSSSPSSSLLRLLRTLNSIWREDEVRSFRREVAAAWEALLANLLPGGRFTAAAARRAPITSLGVRTIFDHVVTAASDLLTAAPLGSHAVNVAAAVAPPPLNVSLLTLASDPDEAEKHDLLRILSRLLDATPSPRYVRSNRDLVFSLLLESLRHPHAASVQATILHMLDRLAPDLKVLRGLAAPTTTMQPRANQTTLEAVTSAADTALEVHSAHDLIATVAAYMSSKDPATRDAAHQLMFALDVRAPAVLGAKHVGSLAARANAGIAAAAAANKTAAHARSATTGVMPSSSRPPHHAPHSASDTLTTQQLLDSALTDVGPGSVIASTVTVDSSAAVTGASPGSAANSEVGGSSSSGDGGTSGDGGDNSGLGTGLAKLARINPTVRTRRATLLPGALAAMLAASPAPLVDPMGIPLDEGTGTDGSAQLTVAAATAAAAAAASNVAAAMAAVALAADTGATAIDAASDGAAATPLDAATAAAIDAASAPVRDLFASSAVAIQTVLRHRARLASRLRHVLRVPGTLVNLERAPTDRQPRAAVSDSVLFVSPSEEETGGETSANVKLSLLRTRTVEAMLPRAMIATTRTTPVVLSVQMPSFPGVPPNATTIPPLMLPPPDADAEAMKQLEAEAKENRPEDIAEEDEEEEEEEEEDDDDEDAPRKATLSKSDLAARKTALTASLGVPHGFVIASTDLVHEVPEKMVLLPPSSTTTAASWSPHHQHASAQSWSDRHAQVPTGFLSSPFDTTHVADSSAPLRRRGGEVDFLPDANGDRTLSKTMLPLLSGHDGIRRETDAHHLRRELASADATRAREEDRKKKKAQLRPMIGGASTDLDAAAASEPPIAGPRDFHVGTVLRFEVTHDADEAGRLIDVDLRETRTYEAIVRDVHRSVLEAPMAVQGDDDDGSNDGLAVGATFMLQVRDRLASDVRWDVAVEVRDVFTNQDFIRAMLAPPQEEERDSRTDHEEAELEDHHDHEEEEEEDPETRRIREAEAELRAIAEPDGVPAVESLHQKPPKRRKHKRAPIPAGVTELGATYFYPPVNLPPLPVGIDEDGRPIFQLPSHRVKPVPAGYTLDGRPFYEPKRPAARFGATLPDLDEDDEDEAAREKPLPPPVITTASAFGPVLGYTRDGVPFSSPTGARLPNPSGYTAQGIPFYDAAALLRFLDREPSTSPTASPSATTQNGFGFEDGSGKKEAPFFKALFSKRRLRFVSQGRQDSDTTHAPFDPARALRAQATERADAEEARRERARRNEEDGLMAGSGEVDPSQPPPPPPPPSSTNGPDPAAERDPRLPPLLQETFRFNLVSLVRERVADREHSSSPDSADVGRSPRRRSTRSSLRHAAANFTDAQRARLRFHVTAIPARWFRVQPALVDLTAAGAGVMSPEIKVTFDPAQCPPSKASEGKLVLRWADGTLLTHAPIHVRVGPFIALERALDQETEAWCAIGLTRRIRFHVVSLVDFTVGVQVDLTERAADTTAAATAVVQKDQLSLESLEDEAFDLASRESRLIHVAFAPVREGFFEALLTATASGIERAQIAVTGVGGLPVAFQILQGNLKTVHAGDDEARAARRAAKKQLKRARNASDARAEALLSSTDDAPRIRSGLEEEKEGDSSDYMSTSEDDSTDLSDSDSDFDEPRPLAGALKSTIMVLDQRKRRPRRVKQPIKSAEGADALTDTATTDGATNGIAGIDADAAKEERRARRRARRPRYRPLSASAMSYFQESLDQGGREHFVDFGICDVDGPSQLRAIDMQNLLAYKVVVVVACRSTHFEVRARFHEVPARGSAKIPVTFTPRPGMDGLVTGTLEVFWQDATHTVFHLQAFVGQPLVFTLAPRAFFAPCSVGEERSLKALAYNRSPYHLTWDCTPFGPPNSIAADSFRHIARARSQQGVREEEEEEEDGLTSLVPDRRSDLVGPAPGRARAAALFGQALTTRPYANTLLHLVFTCTARGVVTAPLGIRLLSPHRQSYPASRAHAVLLVGIGMQPSYTLPLRLLQEARDQRRAELASGLVDDADQALKDGVPAIEPESNPKTTSSDPAHALAALANDMTDLASLDPELQVELLNGLNFDFGGGGEGSGGDLRDDLARLQQWILGMTNTVAAAAAGIPPPVRAVQNEYVSRLANSPRDRFTLSPNALSLLGRWSAGGGVDKEKESRDVTALWQLMSRAVASPEEFVLLRTPCLTVQPWQGSLLPESMSLGSQQAGATHKLLSDGTIIVPGSVTFQPAPGPSEFSVFEGFVMAVSLRDKHYAATPVHAERSHGVLISPESAALNFARVLVDARETEYLLLRSRMLMPVTWSISLPGASAAGGGGGGFTSFVIPTRTGSLEPAETEVVRVSFEPNAQGHYKEVCEVRIADAATGETLLTRELLLTGTGHAPHIGGFPSSVDFGNVPLGWVGFVWMRLTNHGFVDDEVSLSAPAPFLASHTHVRLRAKASVRVALFFVPRRTASVRKTVTVLAGGKVVRIALRGRGGVVKLSCRSKEPPGEEGVKKETTPAPTTASTSDFPTLASTPPVAPPALIDGTRCHIDFGATQRETLVQADLHLTNEGTLPVRVSSVSLRAEFHLLSEGVFSNETSTRVQISTRANRWAMISKQKTGVAMAINALHDEQGDTGTETPARNGSMGHGFGSLIGRGNGGSHARGESLMVRPLTSNAGSSIAQVVKEALAGRVGKRSSRVAGGASIGGSSTFGDSFDAGSSVPHPTPVLMVPPGHTLRLKIEFRPRHEQEFDELLEFPFSEDPTKPLALFQEDADDARIEEAEARLRQSQAQRTSGVAVSSGVANEDPFGDSEEHAPRGDLHRAAEVGYFDLARVSTDVALFFAFMRRREAEHSDTHLLAEHISAFVEQTPPHSTAIISSTTSTASTSSPASAPEQAILDAYRSVSFDELRDAALECDLHAALLPRAAVDPAPGCTAGLLRVRMSGGCYGSITLAPSSINFGPVPAARFLLATNRGGIGGVRAQLLAHRTSTQNKARARVAPGGATNDKAILSPGGGSPGSSTRSLVPRARRGGQSMLTSTGGKPASNAGGWAARRAGRPSIIGSADATHFEDASSDPSSISGLLPGEFQSSLAAEEAAAAADGSGAATAAPGATALAAGLFDLSVHNGSIHAQTLKLEYIKPACFSLAPELAATGVNSWQMAAGSSLTLRLAFAPHETNTVYMGVAVFSHLFGTLTVPLRGVGASAHLHVVGAVSANESPSNRLRPLLAAAPSDTTSALAHTRGESSSSTTHIDTINEEEEGSGDSAPPRIERSLSSMLRPSTSSSSLSSVPEAPLGSSSKPLGGRWHLRFPPVKVHSVATRAFTLRNAGLLPSRYVLTCVTAPFAIEHPVTRKETRELRGVLESGESLQVRATCLVLPGRSREDAANTVEEGSYTGQLVAKWQLAPRGIWVEERLELAAKIGAPKMELNKTQLDFGRVVLGRPSVRRFLVRNTGDAPLEWEVSDLLDAMNLHDSGEFDPSEPSPVECVDVLPRSGIVRARSAAVVRVVFEPRGLASLEANLSLTSDGGEGRLALMGSPLVPQLTVPELTRNFGLLRVGQPVTISFELVNTGATALHYLLHLDDEAHVSAAGFDIGTDDPNAESESPPSLLEQVRAASEMLHESMLARADGRHEFSSSFEVRPRTRGGFEEDGEDESVEDVVAEIDALRYIDALSPEAFDAGRRARGATGGADTDAPLVLNAFSAFPWSGLLLPRASVTVDLTVSPKEIGVSYLARLVVAPGVLVRERRSMHGRGGPVAEVFQSLDLHTGVIACVGGGADLELGVHVDRDKFASWESDLGLDATSLMLPGIVPLGLIMAHTNSGGATSTASSRSNTPVPGLVATGAAASSGTIAMTPSTGSSPSLSSSRTLSLHNSGNLPGTFVIESMSGGNMRLQRTLEREQSRTGWKAPLPSPPSSSSSSHASDRADDTVFSVSPLSGVIAPGETIWLTVSVSSTRIGFLQQQYRVTSPDAPSLRDSFTLLAYGGEARLEFVPPAHGLPPGGASVRLEGRPGLDFGVAQVGTPVTRYAVLRNAGNQSVSFTASLRHVSRTDSWRDVRKLERMLGTGGAARRTLKGKALRALMQVREDADEKRDAAAAAAAAANTTTTAGPAHTSSHDQSSPPQSPPQTSDVLDAASLARLETLPLPNVCPFTVVSSAPGAGGPSSRGALYKVAPHSETRVEIQYLPSEDGVRDRVELVLDWLGPTMSLVIFGAAGTGAIEVAYPELEAQQTAELAKVPTPTKTPTRRSSSTSVVPLPPLQYGLCLVGQTQWRPLTVRNTGTLDLEFRVRVSNPDLVAFRAPHVSSATHAHRVAAKRSVELQVGITPSLVAPVSGAITIISPLGELVVPLSATGARFGADLARGGVRFGEVAVEALVRRATRLVNTGDLVADFRVDLAPELIDFIMVPSARVKRRPAVSANEGTPMTVTTTSSSTTKGIELDEDGFETVYAAEINATGAVITTPEAAAAAVRANAHSHRTLVAVDALRRASSIVGAAAPTTVEGASGASVESLVAALRPRFRRFQPLVVRLEPGDVAELAVDFLAASESLVSGLLRVQPLLPGVHALESLVKARAAAMRISVSDTREVAVGKVMLHRVATVVRTLANTARQSDLVFRLELSQKNAVANITSSAGSDPDPLRVWSATPMSGTLNPNSSLAVSISYHSVDSDESEWHEVELRVVNVTRGTIDARLALSGCVAFPRLAIAPPAGISPAVMQVEPKEPPRPTSPLMEDLVPAPSPRSSTGLSGGSAAATAGTKSAIGASKDGVTTTGRAPDRYFDFGVRSVSATHFRPLDARNDGTGALHFTTRIVLTRRTHARHMAEVKEAQAKEAKTGTTRKTKPAVTSTADAKKPSPPSVPAPPSTNPTGGKRPPKTKKVVSAAAAVLATTTAPPSDSGESAPWTPEHPFFLVTSPSASSIEVFGGVIREKSAASIFVGFRPLFEGEYHAVLVVHSDAGTTETIQLRGRGSAFNVRHSLSASQELAPPVELVFDFGHLFLGERREKSFLVTNLAADFSAVWLAFAADDGREENAAEMMDLMRVWADCLAVQGRLCVEDIYSLPTLLRRTLRAEKRGGPSPPPTVRNIAAPAVKNASMAAREESEDEEEDSDLTLDDIVNPGDVVTSKKVPTKKKVGKKADKKSSEKEKNLSTDQKDTATLAAAELLKAQAALASRLESSWTRRSGAFSLFPESILLGPGSEAEHHKQTQEVVADEAHARRQAAAREASGSQQPDDEEEEDNTFLTSIDGRHTATVSSPKGRPASSKTAKTAGPSTSSSDSTTVGLPSLARLAPSNERAFVFHVDAAVDYVPGGVPDELWRARQQPQPLFDPNTSSSEAAPTAVAPVPMSASTTTAAPDRRLPDFKSMLTRASIDPAGRLHERTILVRTVRATVSLRVRARFGVFPVTLSRDAINFHKTLTNAPLFRRVTLSNPAPYNVPFRVASNHACFTVEPSFGLLPPESSVELVVRFLSADPLDTHDLITTPAGPPTLLVHTLEGVLPPQPIACHAICTDYIFATRLFRDIDFGVVFVKFSGTSSISLANVTDADVDYRLLYEKRGVHAPVTIALADQAGVVKRDQTRKVTVRFDPTEECDIDMPIGIETKAGTFHIRVTGRAVIPSVAVSTNKLSFGTVGVGYTVAQDVTLTNTCALPLRIFAKPTEVEEEVGTGLVAVGEPLTPSSAANATKPSSFVVDLARAGITLEPNATFNLRVHYAPSSTPVLVRAATGSASGIGVPLSVMKRGGGTMFGAGSLDTSKLRDSSVEEEDGVIDASAQERVAHAPVLSNKMRERARTMSLSQSRPLTAALRTTPGPTPQQPPRPAPAPTTQAPAEPTSPPTHMRLFVQAEDEEESLEASSGISMLTADALDAAQLRDLVAQVTSRPRAASSLPMPSPANLNRNTPAAGSTSQAPWARHNSLAVPGGAVASSPSSAATAAAAASPAATTTGNQSASTSHGSAPAGAQWEFPVDRLTIPLYAEGRDTMVASIKCLGKGGLLELGFSHHNIGFGNVPKGATRRDEVLVSNRGDVPVVVALAADDTDVPCASHQTRAGLLQVGAVDDNSPLISLAPGEERAFAVELLVTGEGGEFHLPFRVSLRGTTTPKRWHFGVRGFVDDIRLSGSMASFLAQEQLDAVRTLEVAPNAHLTRVLEPVDYVSTVSVHHELALVEPLCSPSGLDHLLSLPAALAPNVLLTFKRWYTDRMPLRLTHRTDEFARLQTMLADKTVVHRINE